MLFSYRETFSVFLIFFYYFFVFYAKQNFKKIKFLNFFVFYFCFSYLRKFISHPFYHVSRVYFLVFFFHVEGIYNFIKCSVGDRGTIWLLAVMWEKKVKNSIIQNKPKFFFLLFPFFFLFICVCLHVLLFEKFSGILCKKLIVLFFVNCMFLIPAHRYLSLSTQNFK